MVSSRQVSQRAGEGPQVPGAAAPDLSRPMEPKKSSLLLAGYGFEEIKEVEEEYNCPSSMNLNSGETFRRQRMADRTPEISTEVDPLSSRRPKPVLSAEFSGADVLYSLDRTEAKTETSGARTSFFRGVVDGVRPRGSPDSKENYPLPSDKKGGDLSSKTGIPNFRKLKSPKASQDRPPSHGTGPLKQTCLNLSGHTASGPNAPSYLFKSFQNGSGAKPPRKSPPIDSKRRNQGRLFSPFQNKSVATAAKREAASYSLCSVGSAHKAETAKGPGTATSLSVKKNRKRDYKMPEPRTSDEHKHVDLRLFRDSASGSEVRDHTAPSTFEDGYLEGTRVGWFLKRSSKKTVSG